MNKKSKEQIDAAHKGWWRTFEFIFGIPFLAAIVLEFTAPIPLTKSFLSPVVITVGILLIITGVILVFLARREFAQNDQLTDPGHPTSKLITTGVFSISRNPLYLGGVCIVAGIALVFNLGWIFILLVPSLAACHYILIIPEEKYLAAKFDEKYRQYTATVYRWFGRKMKMN